MEFIMDINLGRSDFIGGIDNEALDFGQMDQFIPMATTAKSPSCIAVSSENNANSANVNTLTFSQTSVIPLSSDKNNNDESLAADHQEKTEAHSHLPESPPDSNSEPSYSPANLQAMTSAAVAAIENSILNNKIEGIISNDHDNINSFGERDTKKGIHLPSISTLTSSPSHICVTSQHNHNQPEQIISDITLTDMSQSPINLHSIENLQSHHNNINISHQQNCVLNVINQNNRLPMQQHLRNLNTTYIRTNQNLDIQNIEQQNETNSLNKNENLFLESRHQSNFFEQQLTMEHTIDVTFLDLENNCKKNLMNTQNQVTKSCVQHLNTNNLTHIAPEMYSNAKNASHNSSASPITKNITNMQNIIPKSPNEHCRKRKLSTPESEIITPELGFSTSPVCARHLEPDSLICKNFTSINTNLLIPDSSLDGCLQNPDSTGTAGNTNNSSDSSSLQCIKFTPFQQKNWHVLCDQNLRDLSAPYYRIDADKGFNFSNSDDAFVCQKKNHFQITCHAQLQGNAVFVRNSSGLEKIKSFYLHFYGVKLESPNHVIRVEQSQSDRSKKPFHPVLISFRDNLVSKITVGRLHFSETTSNNMRKKGRPNPEQRYFQLVVGLHAHTHSGNYPVVCQSSQRIIVRASNPGQFESDVELCWNRGITQDSIFHAGHVGINTDHPDESLVVHGNIKISGHIIQPSDIRAKQEIKELNSSDQLKNLQKIRIVKYRYEPEFALLSGLKSKNDATEIIDTGVIAQEVREVLPDAVQEAGSILLPNGQVIDNFLLVNKDRILMENIGAVKELCKVTGSLETRIEQLEKIDLRLLHMQKPKRSSSQKCKYFTDGNEYSNENCSIKAIQIIIIILVIIMATCLISISTLYFIEHSKQGYIANYGRYKLNQYISHDAILIHDDMSTNRNSLYLENTSSQSNTAYNNGNKERNSSNIKPSLTLSVNSKNKNVKIPFTSSSQNYQSFSPSSSISSSAKLQLKSLSSGEDPPPQEPIIFFAINNYSFNSNKNYNESNYVHGKSDNINEGYSSKNNDNSKEIKINFTDNYPKESSSKKSVVNPILMSHDIENNSIDDGNSQKLTRAHYFKRSSDKEIFSIKHKLNNCNDDINKNDTKLLNNVDLNNKENSPNRTHLNNSGIEDSSLQYLTNSSDVLEKRQYQNELEKQKQGLEEVKINVAILSSTQLRNTSIEPLRLPDNSTSIVKDKIGCQVSEN